MATSTAYSRRSSWRPENFLDTATFIPNWIDETTDGYAGQSGESEEGFASSLYKSCMKVFQELYKQACRSSSLSPQEQHRLKEDLGKLFLWGDGFGYKMLDRILEQSLDLRDTVLGFIAGIGKALTGSAEVLAIDPTTQQGATFFDQVDDLYILIEKADSIIVEAGHTGDNDSDTDSQSDASVCSKSDVLADISFHILCLMDLVPTMERTLSHILLERQTERLLPILPMISFQVSEPARAYAQNIFDKFPSADIKLIERLGEVNWRRHMCVRQRMKQKGKNLRVTLDSGIEIPSTSATSDVTLSSPPTSATSDVIFESGNADRRHGRRITLSTSDFQCKICGEIVENTKEVDDNALELHIFADLEPYCCMFSTCRDELLTFPTHKLWVDHELSEHRLEKVWDCLKCAETFNESQHWRKHVESCHDMFFSTPQFQVAAALAENKTPALVEHTKCPLCLKSVGEAGMAFATHVGKHMEEIALTALSPEIDSDTESEAESLENDTYNACTEDETEDITHQLELGSDYGTASPVESGQRDGDVLGTENLTRGDPQEPSELRSHPPSTPRTDMVTLQPQHLEDLYPLPPPRSMYQEYPQDLDRAESQHINIKRPASRRRVRTTVSCQFCTTHKFCCSGIDVPEDGRCTNCHLSQQECIFAPVVWQAFVPAYTAYPHLHNTESSTEEFPFNLDVPGAHVCCTVFLQTRKSNSWTRLRDTTVLQSLGAMFLCMEHEFSFRSVQVLQITAQCDVMEESYLVKRNDTEEYGKIIRTSKKLLEHQLRRSKNKKIVVDFFIEPVDAREMSPSYEGKNNEDQKSLYHRTQPPLSWNLETPQTTEKLVTSQVQEVYSSQLKESRPNPNSYIPERDLSALPFSQPRLSWTLDTTQAAAKLVISQVHEACSPQLVADESKTEPNSNIPGKHPSALPSPQPHLSWYLETPQKAEEELVAPQNHEEACSSPPQLYQSMTSLPDIPRTTRPVISWTPLPAPPPDIYSTEPMAKSLKLEPVPEDEFDLNHFFEGC